MSKINKRLSGWRELILPGALVIVLVCGLRLSGFLQVQEWMALDVFSRQCPTISPPERIVLISVDESDYKAFGEFPLSHSTLAQTLSTLQQFEPRVIGLSLFTDFDLDANKDTDPLLAVMQSSPNLVTVERAFDWDPAMNIAPPPNVPSERVGFVDSVVDSDGELRRTVLAARDSSGQLRFSLAMQLVRQYLKADGILLNVGANSRLSNRALSAETASNSDVGMQETDEPIRFGTAEIEKVYPNSGGYVRTDVDGYQTLVHFCALQEPFQTIPLRELVGAEQGQSNLLTDQERLRDSLAETLRDRIVVIGNITTSVKESYITSAVRNTLYSRQVAGPPTATKLIYGVEVQSLVVKQLLSSVLDWPCMQLTWVDPVEYLWIVGWGLLGMALSIALKSPWKSVVGLSIAVLGLVFISYQQLLENWWTPMVPALLALVGAGLVTAFFDWDMRLELAQRKNTVERTYEAVHNGPLQQLAAILRNSETLSGSQLQQQLGALNVEMRSAFEYMRQEANAGSDRLYLTSDIILDLQQPLPDLLSQTYESTLNQPLPEFASVLSYIPPDFECLSHGRFNAEQKRGLCLFLQEALVNVGKYATGATRVDVVCVAEARHYRLQVIDNGVGLPAGQVPIGEGTMQAVALAQRLRGQFQRRANEPQGVVCEMRWPKRRFRR